MHDTKKNSLLPLWAKLRIAHGFADAEEIDNIARQVQLQDENSRGELISCAPNTSCLFTCLQTSCTSSCETACQDSCKISCQTTCKLSCKTTCEGACQTTCETTCTMSCQHVCISGHTEAALPQKTKMGGEF